MKRYFIHTFGCQMNVYDSLRMGELLLAMGYGPTPVAEEADLILLNTCSIREKAEDKLLSALGRYRLIKHARGAWIGIGGCIAQQEKEKLLKKAPFVDFVFGTDAVRKLPHILEALERGGQPVVEVAWEEAEPYTFLEASGETSRGKACEFITIMKGCDNLCAYCVVPHTRGREISRPYADILAQAQTLLGVGIKELTLLGQNVNSFAGGISFAELLLEVAKLPGLERLRFTTSHPQDLSPALIEAFKVEHKIAPHIHLPVQSGSDAILKRMRRNYTVAEYMERLSQLRAARPDIAVTTDVIVGFPGETEADFERTLALTAEARFDGQFSFIFSARPKTLAALKEDEWGRVPHEAKAERLKRLQALQKQVSAAHFQSQVGQVAEVLVEGASKQNPGRLHGKTPQNRTVNFEGEAQVGELIKVHILRASSSALFGQRLGTPACE
ncbi:MAG: tRNA (N6-isopentenyl adenosine(37)-C2)-methylthiotransferase MiaB [Proteobacteria bacterium]|nr:tRNA (N6-isopentenyl adenosine(37)-C2)-methylthiotransferase MiaB [Cystobacterineae bacterium]MCL2258371.1 tRNA (N6-isopentenyl adenosine(37)-C2)-methylthiotransferase MiaB [Cystobacterineae bacterium]MCL2315266.1 tRNA (N6-isopentenyl adenosine(37)-C2)-methylthiotransferase MiaB [Pseudomonadota bacterium]